MRSPRKSTTCWLYGQSSILFHFIGSTAPSILTLSTLFNRLWGSEAGWDGVVTVRFSSGSYRASSRRRERCGASMAGISRSSRQAQGEKGGSGTSCRCNHLEGGWVGNKHLQHHIMVQVSGCKLPRVTRLPGLRGAATGVLFIQLMSRDWEQQLPDVRENLSLKNVLPENSKPKEQRQEKERTRRVTGNTDLSENADRDKSFINSFIKKEKAQNMDKGRKT